MILFLAGALALQPAAAPDPGLDLVSAHGRWAAFRLPDGRCEARGRAWRHLPDSQRERQPMVHFLFDAQGRLQAVAARLRKTARDGSGVMLGVDDARFELQGEGRFATSRDAGQGLAIVAALRTGDRMRITGHARDGSRFTDYFPLEGVNGAIDAAAAACAVKRLEK